MIGFEEQEKLLGLIGSELKKRTEAVIIGGSAMLFYNFPKTTTKDIDMVLFSEDDRKNLVRVLERMGFKPTNSPNRENEPVRMAFKEYILDIFVKNVFKFRISDAVLKRAKERIDFGNLVVSVISPEDIILSKSMTDRPGDRDDAVSIINAVNVKWDVIVDECVWQSENADPRFSVYLFDFFDELVHEYRVGIPKYVEKRVKKIFKDFIDSVKLRKDS